MDAREIARLRLEHLLLVRSPCASARDVVSRLGALQAQDHTGALWSVGARLPGATERSVEAALEAKEVVRSWPLRGTIHVVAGEDLRWITALVAPRVIAKTARRAAELELDEPTFERCRRSVERALAGGRALERDALLQEIERDGVFTGPHRGYHILFRLSLERVLCFGPRAGKQLTFTLVDGWVPAGPELAGEAALGELARRYFTSHGPATLGDFVRWTGLTVGEARTGVEVAGAALEAVTAEKKTWWLPRTRPGAKAAKGEVPRALLLAGFDEYILGYEDKTAVLDDAHAERIVPGGNGIFRPTIVLDGRVVGTWKASATKKAVKIALTPFVKLKKADREAIDLAAERYGAFVGLPASVSVAAG